MDNLNFIELIDEKNKLKSFLDKELEKVKKAWLKNKSYQNTWIRLGNKDSERTFEIQSQGNTYRAKPGEKDFAEYEIDSRLDTVREIWYTYYNTPGFTITLAPLTCGYDYYTMMNESCAPAFFESKTRKYNSNSTLFTDQGVAIEKLKIEEAVRDRYFDSFYYINKFSDGNIFLWHLDSLPNWVWVPREVEYPDSTINFKRMKKKVVYYLPIDLRVKECDMKAA